MIITKVLEIIEERLAFLNSYIDHMKSEKVEEGLTTVFESYTYDTNGLAVPRGDVDECFAKRHTVWAITINERMGN